MVPGEAMSGTWCVPAAPRGTAWVLVCGVSTHLPSRLSLGGGTPLGHSLPGCTDNTAGRAGRPQHPTLGFSALGAGALGRPPLALWPRPRTRRQGKEGALEAPPMRALILWDWDPTLVTSLKLSYFCKSTIFEDPHVALGLPRVTPGGTVPSVARPGEERPQDSHGGLVGSLPRLPAFYHRP